MVSADRASRRRQQQPMTCPSIWTWFFGGILTGIGLSVLTYSLLLHPQPPATPGASVPPAPVASEQQAADPEKPHVEVREVPVVINKPEVDEPISASSADDLSAAASAEEEQSKPADEDKKRPRFEFYDELPSASAGQTAPSVEAPTPTSEAALPQFPVALEPGQAPPSSNASSGAKALQVASFQQYKEAEVLKARLALLGLQASIQTAIVNGRQWYRVRLGPFYDAQSLEQARQRLIQANLDPLTVPF